MYAKKCEYAKNWFITGVWKTIRGRVLWRVLCNACCVYCTIHTHEQVTTAEQLGGPRILYVDPRYSQK
jgi:hypothetical protein